MKQRTCATARRWMFATVLAAASVVVPAHGVLAQRGDTTPPTTPVSVASSLVCDGTITTSPDAAGTQRPVCVTPQPASASASGSSTNRDTSNDTNHDTTYGILIGATLVIAGSATSLYARRRRFVLGKPFRRRSV